MQSVEKLMAENKNNQVTILKGKRGVEKKILFGALKILSQYKFIM